MRYYSFNPNYPFVLYHLTRKIPIAYILSIIRRKKR